MHCCRHAPPHPLAAVRRQLPAQPPPPPPSRGRRHKMTAMPMSAAGAAVVAEWRRHYSRWKPLDATLEKVPLSVVPSPCSCQLRFLNSLAVMQTRSDVFFQGSSSVLLDYVHLLGAQDLTGTCTCANSSASSHPIVQCCLVCSSRPASTLLRIRIRMTTRRASCRQTRRQPSMKTLLEIPAQPCRLHHSRHSCRKPRSQLLGSWSLRNHCWRRSKLQQCCGRAMLRRAAPR